MGEKKSKGPTSKLPPRNPLFFFCVAFGKSIVCNRTRLDTIFYNSMLQRGRGAERTMCDLSVGLRPGPTISYASVYVCISGNVLFMPAMIRPSWICFACFPGGRTFVKLAGHKWDLSKRAVRTYLHSHADFKCVLLGFLVPCQLN